MAYYKININRVSFGVFCADSKSEALDACAREAGYKNQIDYEHYLLDNAAQAAGYRDWDEWGAAGPEAQRPDPEKVLDDEYDIVEVMPDGIIYGDLERNGITVYVENGNVYIADQQDVENRKAATEDEIAKAIRDAIQIQMTWAHESGDDKKLTELRTEWDNHFPGDPYDA